MEQIVLSWSGGKDSALALDRLQRSGLYEVTGLFTAFSGIRKNVNLHFTHYDLIRAQADSLGLELIPVFLSENASDNEYESKHKELFNDLKERFVRKVAFGDIFLEPIREFRDDLLMKSGMQPVYPLWKENTSDLVNEFIDRGFEAVITAIDVISLDENLLFRRLNRAFLSQLGGDVDPCGENGEYHSFVFNGPGFSHPLHVTCNHVVEKDFRPKMEMHIKGCFLKLEQPVV